MPTPEQWQLFGQIGSALAGLVALIALSAQLGPRHADLYQSWRAIRTLKFRLGAEAYHENVINNATRYYIRPDCQSVDPAGEASFRHTIPAREPMFAKMDEVLTSPESYKFLFVLADSGMGKTSFLLNYFAYHWRSSRRRRRFDLLLVPLGVPGSDRSIQETPKNRRGNTVLLLDALDEDAAAIADHRARLSQLLELSTDFRAVVITCRTQFFTRDEEIPLEAGKLKFGPLAAGERPNPFV